MRKFKIRISFQNNNLNLKSTQKKKKMKDMSSQIKITKIQTYGENEKSF